MHAYIDYVADRAASREVEGLADYYGIGQLIVTGELTYDVARDELTAAFKARDLAASTAKVYVSQGYSLAQLFTTFDEVTEYADEECNGSRSLKRIYDSVKAAAAEPKVAKVPTPLIDVVLAGLANLKDAGEIARVRDAAIAMLTVKVAAA
jgi:hypothetical protein